MPEPGPESLVQAYLPLLEQWEAQERVECRSRRPISFWLLSVSCTSRWRAIVLGCRRACRVYGAFSAPVPGGDSANDCSFKPGFTNAFRKLLDRKHSPEIGA
jgi:hypothetical protein